MAYTDKHIVEIYSGILERLSDNSKMELIENLSKSLKKKGKPSEPLFYKSFGAFVSDKSAEEIVSDIKSNRRFRRKEINL